MLSTFLSAKIYKNVSKAKTSRRLPDSQEGSEQRHLRIYRTIRERISLLEYTPGMVLSEAELATEFDVSRTPIRRVLQRLHYEGLTEIRNGVGTIVKDIDIKMMKEIYDLRMHLAEAFLEEAKLIGAKLDRATMLITIMHRANFTGASLVSANVRQALGRGAVFIRADLSGADLGWAVLVGADFRQANLSGAILEGADVSGADFTGAICTDASPCYSASCDQRAYAD